MSVKISEVMTSTPHSIGHDISVAKAQEMMTEYRCHHLPVLDGGKLVGLISSRDLQIARSISTGPETKVEELMTEEAFTVDPDSPAKEVIQEMLNQHIGSAIVRAKDGQNWGIFTITDAMKLLVERL